MKNSLFALVIFFLGCAPHPKPANCAAFRNGRFKSKYAGHRYIIERSGLNQKEYFIDAKDSLISFVTIKWLDDCTYTLTPTKETLKRSKLPANAMITVTITNTTSNSYTQMSTSNYIDTTLSSEFFKIE
jgi:hypothetical protein